jgi:hypothetical protein
MNVGKFLDRMDKVYHHQKHGPMGWVFCDLLDYHYGMSAWALLKERGLPRAILLLGPLVLARPFRVKA